MGVHQVVFVLRTIASLSIALDEKEGAEKTRRTSPPTQGRNW